MADNSETWPFVGAAWENRDGSFNLVLDTALPSGARVQLKKRKDAVVIAKPLP